MGKWFLHDWMAPQRVLIGTLTNVHDSGGVLDGGDNDTNLEIVPRPEPQFTDLLQNRHNQANQNGLIECEINVGADWRSQYEFFAASLVGREVTAQGVFVEDDDHASKTELHPTDVIFARVEDSQLPGDWIELVTGTDPDDGSGALEWGIAAALLAVALLGGALATPEWRRPRPART
jgi:hypothetical protein